MRNRAVTTAAAWWHRLRGVPARRLAYEIGLSAALSAVTAALTLRLDTPPPAVVALLVPVDLALVGLRHRFPASVLIVAAALGSLVGRLDHVLLFGLGFSAGYRIPGPWRLTATLAGAFAVQIAGSRVRTGTTSWPEVLVTAAMLLVVVAFPATLARLSAQRRHILTLMHERTLYLRGQQQIVAEQARVREAHRIAREMHDSLGHRLTLISLYTGALRSAPERAEETRRLLQATSASAMEELRHILTVLRAEAPGEDDRQRATLDDAEDLLTDARSAGARADLVRSGTPVAVPAMIDQAAYRTLQEGLTNALRHARGGAIRAAVRYEEDALIVEVVNGAGRPHDGATSGQGLYGLAERVRIAGGVLYHGPEPDGGFRLAASLPLTSTGPQPTETPSNGPPSARPQPTGPVADEFGEDLRRVDRRRRAWTVGAGLGVLLVVGLCAGGIWLATTQQTVSRGTYDGLRIGDDAATVRGKLPDPSAQLEPRGVASPPGAECTTFRAEPSLRERDAEKGYRFCFRAGVLISKEKLADVD